MLLYFFERLFLDHFDSFEFWIIMLLIVTKTQGMYFPQADNFCILLVIPSLTYLQVSN